MAGTRGIPIQRAAQPPATGQSTVKSAGRALDILEVLSAASSGLGFTELVNSQGIPKSSLHALLSVLIDRGYVEFDSTRRTYALGIRTWEVGQAYIAHRDLLEHALPVMQRVVDEINETVQLAVLDGIENVYLAKVDCSHPVRLQSEVGKRLHAHATGLGKVLLAGLSDTELRARFDGIALPSFNSHSIADVPALIEVLKTVRQLGFAVDDQEYTPGLRCVAVPIHDFGGNTVAALSASVPLTRAEPDQLETALRAISAASLEISRQLGSSTQDSRLTNLVLWHGNVLDAHSAATDGR